MGQSSSAIKTVFTQCDLSKSGTLDISEILKIKSLLIEGKSVNFQECASVLLLFMFDQSQEGSLSLKEFERAIRFLEDKKKLFSKQKLPPAPEIFTTVSNENRNSFDLDRDSGPQMITGKHLYLSRGSSQDLEVSRSSLDLEMHRVIQQEAMKYLGSFLQRKDGREKFIKWLWKMADIDKSNTISVEELSKLLTLLAQDGLVVSRLFFDEKPFHDITAQDIMNEYDVGKTGELTFDEFFRLAEVIVENYLSLVTINGLEYGRYQIMRKIGEGSVGTIYSAIDKFTKAPKAIKLIPRKKITDMTKIDSEIKAMLMLDHPNILRLEEVLETSDSDILFVTELCQDFSVPQNVEEKYLRFYFKQLLSAVIHCHERGVCHRDLKSENLLLDSNGDLKVADFGHAGIYSEGWDIFSPELVGTLFHLAPEQLCGQAYSGEKVDIWAMGVILYHLRSGELPFKGNNIDDFLKVVDKVEFNLPSYFSSELSSLIKSILVRDPAQRLTLKAIADHPWTKGEAVKPNFSHSQLELKNRGEWATLKKILNEMNIRSIEKNGQINTQLQCRIGTDDLKFTIELGEGDPSKPDVPILFVLASGSQKLFQSTLEKIRQKICK